MKVKNNRIDEGYPVLHFRAPAPASARAPALVLALALAAIASPALVSAGSSTSPAYSLRWTFLYIFWCYYPQHPLRSQHCFWCDSLPCVGVASAAEVSIH